MSPSAASPTARTERDPLIGVSAKSASLRLCAATSGAPKSSSRDEWIPGPVDLVERALAAARHGARVAQAEDSVAADAIAIIMGLRQVGLLSPRLVAKGLDPHIPRVPSDCEELGGRRRL